MGNYQCRGVVRRIPINMHGYDRVGGRVLLLPVYPQCRLIYWWENLLPATHSIHYTFMHPLYYHIAILRYHPHKNNGRFFIVRLKLASCLHVLFPRLTTYTFDLDTCILRL